VFFGGGTPSLLPPAQLSRILDALDLRFGISADAEVSLECDPGTFDSNRLREYLALGVTRISLGVQSFDETMLRVCGRAHNAQDARSAVEIVRESSVRSWSLDLISGLPNLTPALWDDTLDAAIAAAPHHLSVYDLQVEDKTAFGRWYTPGVAPLPSEEQAAGMYVTAHHTLQAAGFQHYEVSNFAVAGHKCRHNLRYWSDAEWHAFGLAAANNLGGQRFTRPRRMAEYLAWVADGCATPALVSAKATDAEEALQDCLMLGLRLVDGVRIPDLRARFGDDAVARVLAAAQPAVDDGLMLADEHHLRLAAPRGFLVSTSVLADLFANMERRRAS
jgi:oxygen-independent coproporphyrinogen-3 oxidase